MSLYEARKALERLRMLAFGNDFANEGAIRKDYEAVDGALDDLELLDCYEPPAKELEGQLDDALATTDLESRVANARAAERAACAAELLELGAWCRANGFPARASHTESAARRLQGEGLESNSNTTKEK